MTEPLGHIIQPPVEVSYDEQGDISCAICTLKAADVMAAVRASSSHSRETLPSTLIDEEPKTGWCEGAAGAGIGEWIEFEFTSPVTLAGFEFLGGRMTSWSEVASHGRVTALDMTINGSPTGTVKIQDVLAIRDRGADGAVKPVSALLPALIDIHTNVFPDVPVRRLRLTIADVAPADVGDVTCIDRVRLAVGPSME